jgi:hypothetical protein
MVMNTGLCISLIRSLWVRDDYKAIVRTSDIEWKKNALKSCLPGNNLRIKLIDITILNQLKFECQCKY